MTRLSAPMVLMLVFLIVSPRVAMADSFADDPHPHIRTTDRRLLRLVHDGVRTSDTFRRLVHRLRQSDVVVYLECGGRTGAPDGRLTFVSSVGGFRYVHVRVARLVPAEVQVALIGHELQHAVEIADSPHIVDSSSLAREYQRIGFVNQHLTPGMSFDSEAAVDAGYRVLREMSGRADTTRSAVGKY